MTFLKMILGCGMALACAFTITAHAFEVSDDTGHTLTLNAPAQRIISLSPSITENLFAIGVGDRIIGTTTYSDFPAAAKNIPIIGDYQSLDLERIAALKPDVIIAWQGGNSPAQLAALERLNIPVYFHRVQTLADIPVALMRLAQLTGTEDRAAPIILNAYRTLPLLRDAPQPVMPAFYQVWQAPLMTLNGSSWISDALARCGARNVFAGLPLTAPTVNIEEVLRLKPSIIATATPDGQPDGSLKEWLQWADLPAVRLQGFIYTDADSMNRSTLRTLAATHELCTKINQIRSRLPRP